MRKTTYVLGLTGGIASGKSLVSHYFLERKIPVVDGDVIARKVVKKGSITLENIANTFGQEMLDETGNLNRKKLGKLIFCDKKARKKLDELMDGALRKEILAQITAAKEAQIPLLVLDLPLLFERNYQTYVQGVMVVSVEETTQLQRLMFRDNLTEIEAKQRLKAQWPLSEKKKRGDFIIDNNGNKKDTLQQVDGWLKNQGFFLN